MRKSILTLLSALFFIGLFQIKEAKASHMMGSDLTWTCVGKDSFMLKLVIYRDCNGVPLSPATIYVKCASTGSSVTTASISKPAPVDITPTCGSSCTRCQTLSCSFPYGIEQYTFTKLVILSSAGSCCKLILSYQECCRNGVITTGAANANFYMDASLDRCISPCDNSPAFTNPPIAIICVGQDFQFNHGVIDVDVDSNGGLIDSISYEWTQPLSGAGSTIAYTGSYAYDKPLYFWGFPNAKLPFPRGLQLDPSTGDISFRPMKIEITVMAIKVGEWRRIGGTMTKIGEIRRDLQIIIISCPNNHAPVLSGPYYKEVCATNSVSFSIATNDYDTPDTLLIGWNGAIPGAKWSDNNKKTKHPTGSFTWTPGEQHASSIPYVFTVTVKDDACPVNGASTRAYQILVKPLPKATITMIDSGCGDYHFFAKSVLGNNPSYAWVGNFNPGFVKTGSYIHYKFNGPGKYPFTMEMTAANCSRMYYDTVEVDTFLVLKLTKDHDICYGDKTTLDAGYLYNQGVVTFNWSTKDTIQTLSYTGTKDTFFAVVIQDTLGCKSKDTVKVRVHQLPVVDLGPDKVLCSYGSDVIKADITYDRTVQDSILWIDGQTGNTLLANMTQLSVNDSGIFICSVKDTMGCREDDTLRVLVNPEMLASVSGVTICDKDTATLNATSTGTKTTNVKYLWYELPGGKLVGNKQTLKVSPKTTTDYKLVVRETYRGTECIDSTQLRVRVNPLPSTTWNTIPERCVDGAMLSLNNYTVTDPITCTRQWTSPSSGLLPIFPGDKFNPLVGGVGKFKVVLSIVNPATGCKSKDSGYVTINPLPSPNAGLDQKICTGGGAVPLTGTPLIPAGEWRCIQGVGVQGTAGSYQFNPTASGISDGGVYKLVYRYTDPKGCVNEDTMDMTVYQTPVVEAGTYKDICIDAGIMQLSGSPSGGTWTGKGVTGGDKFDVKIAGLGTHTLKYKYTNVICTVEDEATVTVRPLPVLSVGTKLGPTIFCNNNGYVELTGLPTGGVWTGPAGAINFGNFFNTGINTGTETSYTLTYRVVDQYGCVNTKDLIITVRPAPSIAIDKNAPSLCYPSTFKAQSTYSNASGVNWYKDNDSASGNFMGSITAMDVEYQPSTADLTRLYFWLKVKTTHPDGVCAAVYDSIRVDMSAIPEAKMNIDPKEGCNPHTAIFSDISTIVAGNITKWDWSFGDGQISTDQNPTHEYTTPGTYTVRLKVRSNANCAGETADNVTSHVVPEAGFIPEPEIVLVSAPNIEFKNITGNETPGIKYLWNFGDHTAPDGGISKERDPIYRYTDTGHYKVLLSVVNEFGCTSDTIREIYVMPDVLAFIPSVFSPDKKGKEENEIFKVWVDGIVSFELKIFSRWGEMLYESYDYATHGWPGTYLNSTELCPMGVYVYVMKLKGLDGVDYKYSGTITLVK